MDRTQTVLSYSFDDAQPKEHFLKLELQGRTTDLDLYDVVVDVGNPKTRNPRFPQKKYTCILVQSCRSIHAGPEISMDLPTNERRRLIGERYNREKTTAR